MKAIVLVNERSGACAAQGPGQLRRSIGHAFEAVGISADVRCVAGESLAGEATSAASSDVDVVVAAGGDGTINGVASALAGSEQPMGVLPLGTLNHFAKDLRIPLDLAG